MTRIAWAFLVAMTLSCGPAPRNTAEFRQGVREGRGTTKHVRLEIERPFSDVFDDIKPRVEECFNHTKVRQRGHGTTARIEGTVTAAEMKTVAPDTGELVIKQHDAFQLVADFQAVSASSSSLDIYGMSYGWDEVFAAIEAWARGNPVKCP
jgi:hypothetical protein